MKSYTGFAILFVVGAALVVTGNLAISSLHGKNVALAKELAVAQFEVEQCAARMGLVLSLVNPYRAKVEQVRRCIAAGEVYTSGQGCFGLDIVADGVLDEQDVAAYAELADQTAPEWAELSKTLDGQMLEGLVRMGKSQ